MENIINRYEKAVKILYSNNNYLSGEATRLGYPIINNDTDTAGVAWDKKRKKIIFLFNEKFLNLINDEQMAFILAHETMHVLNMHIVKLNDEIDKKKNRNIDAHKINAFKNKMNIAFDCIANDSLFNIYGFKNKEIQLKQELKDIFIELKKDNPFINKDDLGLISGKNIIGLDTEDMTSDEVYFLIQDKENNGDNTSHNWESFLDKDGNLDKSFIDKVKDLIVQKQNNSMLSDAEKQLLDKMQENLSESTDPNCSKASQEIIQQIRKINAHYNNSLNWNQILIELTEIKKEKDVWNRPNRKLMSIYPDVILPSYTNQEKEKIFIAIDSSGSIDQEACEVFLSVVKNTPKQFEVEAITFDTQCYPFDIKSNKFKGGGGTNFQIIEDYIQNNLKKYPKAIFVLTDGEGTQIKPKYPKKWCWLLYNSCCDEYIKDMKHFNLKDLLR